MRRTRALVAAARVHLASASLVLVAGTSCGGSSSAAPGPVRVATASAAAEEPAGKTAAPAASRANGAGSDVPRSERGRELASLEREPAPAADPVAEPPSRARPTTIPLASSENAPEDPELAAGDAAFEAGDLARAEAHYAAARKLAPKGVAPTVGLARVKIARAAVPLDYGAAKGNPAIVSAAADLTRAGKQATPFGPLLFELGRAKLLLGDAPGALDALQTATRLLPEEPEAHSQLGIAHLATGHADAAVAELTRAVALDPSSPARHGNLGTALFMLGRTRDAVREYETRAHLDAGDARAHSDLGTALLATGEGARALEELERAVKLDPARASLHSNLGYAFQQADQTEQAIGEYREALRIDPRLVSAWLNLGTVLARDPKTRGQARDAFLRARALSPDDPRVKANLDELSALEAGGNAR